VNELLDELRAALVRYVIFPTDEAADAVTLWIAATHAQAAWEIATRLVITAPEKRCGKSRLLDCIESMSHAPLITVNISPAALVRSIGADPPTLLLDEADTVFGKKAADNHEDLRGIVNAGHQRNRPYIRWDATTRTREVCPTFAMAALAGIGDLPDTIMDRAVVIRMRRRGPAERVAPFRTRRDAPPLHDLRDRLAKTMGTYLDELTAAEPDMPLEDRAADTWEPLIAVADIARGGWPKRARSAALKLVAAENAADVEASLGGRLLTDIREVFTGMTVGFLSSQDLVNRLRRLDDAPWNDMDLTMRGLSVRLRPYEIRPGHNAAKTARGYDLEAFREAFARYLPSVEGNVASGTVQVSVQGADQHE
jgi:Protein of unknown function (DUF3631)